MRRGRYCRVTTCPNFKGAKKSTPMFNAPAYDPPLRDKWISWLRMVEPKFNEKLVGCNFNLCDLHFDTDDMKRSGERYRLVPGTIPKYFIPQPDPLAAMDSESDDDLNLDRTKQLTACENSPQYSEQTIEVAVNKDGMISNVPEKSKRPYCTKCVNFNVNVQSTKMKLSKTENRLMTQKSIIDSLRTLLNELKTAQKSEIPNTDVCTICNEKLPTGSLYEHLCIETADDEDDTIKCAYCTRSFRATIALIEHLKISHMIKSYSASCDECDQHYAMKELLQVHKMAKHKKTISKLSPTPSVQQPSISMPLNDDTQSIELELEKLEELEPIKKKQIEQSNENFESSKRCTTTYHHQTPKRRKLEGDPSNNSGYSYSSDGKEMPELLRSNEQSNGNISNQVKNNNKPQLRRITVIKKKNAIIESTSVFEHLPAVDEIKKISAQPLPITTHEGNPLLKPYKCGYSCDERFALPQELNLHMKQKHGIAACGIHLECYQCHERFAKLTDVRKHLSDIHDIKALKDKSRLCDLCGLICKTKNQMTMHYKSHAESATNTPKQLKSLNGNPYCDICKISFKWRATYWRHSLKHRDDEGKKYACPDCPMKCVDKQQIIHHMRKHTGEKPYQCEYCDSKKFTYQKGLKNHLRKHFGDKVYGCRIENCDERFQYQKELQEHMKNDHA